MRERDIIKSGSDSSGEFNTFQQIGRIGLIEEPLDDDRQGGIGQIHAHQELFRGIGPGHLKHLDSLLLAFLALLQELPIALFVGLHERGQILVLFDCGEGAPEKEDEKEQTGRLVNHSAHTRIPGACGG
ncbi:MAG: hypothetical protein A3C54_01395 [Deltaproteobacteria bacterium RIFCSPHIGHO2_02_FULL_60_17]|nr:MAG: hypothetical protein A3C54_01395 [Deltaproteobacteria bacterium RIFCSPHIGHO2_02_FULL_60_17]